MWWMMKSNGYQFMVGTNDSSCHKSGPQLLHFRNSNISIVHAWQAQSWSQILEEKIPVPATSIRDRGYLTSEYIQVCTSSSDNSDILPILQTSQITQAHHYSNSDQQFFIEVACTSSPISEPSTSEQIAASATCLESARCGFSCISDPFTTLDDATEVASNTDGVENDFTPTLKTATMNVVCIPDTSLQSHDSGFVETKL